ncbi:hypothetical protein BJ508DRAFT_309181 [Ascobolus immersus RN42]|uniref:Uncharacterized protein n=1 Tax=Ascobolus immersus RN42 TaxID=1160509 RepID=A0A3N4HZK5_ASCIM|nr:hypothetical protein BJ508DRAFT_309181 [Ascobolus immersus RN42]
MTEMLSDEDIQHMRSEFESWISSLQIPKVHKRSTLRFEPPIRPPITPPSDLISDAFKDGFLQGVKVGRELASDNASQSAPASDSTECTINKGPCCLMHVSARFEKSLEEALEREKELQEENQRLEKRLDELLGTMTPAIPKQSSPKLRDRLTEPHENRFAKVDAQLKDLQTSVDNLERLSTDHWHGWNGRFGDVFQRVGWLETFECEVKETRASDEDRLAQCEKDLGDLINVVEFAVERLDKLETMDGTSSTGKEGAQLTRLLGLVEHTKQIPHFYMDSGTMTVVPAVSTKYIADVDGEEGCNKYEERMEQMEQQIRDERKTLQEHVDATISSRIDELETKYTSLAGTGSSAEVL